MSYQKCLDLAVSGVCAWELAMIELHRGDEQAALDLTRFIDQTTSGSSGNAYATLAFLYGRLAQTDDARKNSDRLSALAREGYIRPTLWALVHIGVGDYDAAYNVIAENLDDARANGVIQNQIGQNITNDPVLEEPRWVELRSQMREQ